MEFEPAEDLYFAGASSETPRVSVFHDESGTFGSTPWFFIGLLWVLDHHVIPFGSTLTKCRDNYFGEIHYSEFSKEFRGQSGAKARVAREWYNHWCGEWGAKTWFNVLAVNTAHPTFQRANFRREFHGYNKFTLIALKSGLAWHFSKHESVHLTIFSDEKQRRPDGIIGDGIETDNFEAYINRQLNDLGFGRNYKCPKVSLTGEVESLSAKRSDLGYSCHEELLQLTDVLLGSVQGAHRNNSGRATKQWFAREISKIWNDVLREPWKQQFGLHRKFSVSLFPDENGQVYQKVRLPLLVDECQFNLF